MAFNPTNASEAREDARRWKKQAGKHLFSTQQFTCHWCNRRVTHPFVAADTVHNPADAYTMAHAPDPWITIKNKDCCPDCFESEIPPRIMPATET